MAITPVSDESARRSPAQLLTAIGHSLAAWFRERKRRAAAKGRKRGFNRALVALFVVLLAMFFYLLNSIFSASTPGSQLTISANFTNNNATWSAQVVNPGGASSNVVNFQVQATSVTPSISSVNEVRAMEVR